VLLIINADDLGASRQVNEETAFLMRRGLVTSATILANSPCFNEAIELARAFPQCSFGVHLNLTELIPLTSASGLEPILENGAMSRKLFSTRLAAPLRKAIKAELDAQVERVLGAGVSVSHLDSHHFIHRRPSLFSILKAVQRRFKINRFRSTAMALPLAPRTPQAALRRKLFQWGWRTIYPTRTTSGWCAFASFHSAVSALPLRWSSLDLMVHPGSLRDDFRAEIELLQSDWVDHLPRGTRLVSYLSI
jgi:predicted glycoside hydrolase/deacetylase ChbG (UPF0249 family)